MKSTLLSLLKDLSYQEGDFTLASGKKSKYFLDVKQTALSAQGNYLIGKLFLNKIYTIPYIKGVCGVELGGCSLATAVSTLSIVNSISTCWNGYPAFYIRKSAKDHGTKKLIEGDKSLTPFMEVVLLEDVTTTGNSALLQEKY
jgi:orotate phosphoribosyltransferase